MPVVRGPARVKRFTDSPAVFVPQVKFTGKLGTYDSSL